MAIKTVVTGGAHASETGGINGKAGDQTQDPSATAAYTGEVSLQSYDESAFKNGYSGYVIYRPIKPDDASAIANIMIKACNNPNIGYSQDTRGGIFTHGADSTVPINCDCSSLVS